jgi:hypothetical protein
VMETLVSPLKTKNKTKLPHTINSVSLQSEHQCWLNAWWNSESFRSIYDSVTVMVEVSNTVHFPSLPI